MSTDYVEQSIDMIDGLDGVDLAPQAIRLLSAGEPVELERLAAAVGRSVGDVEAALRSAGGGERDDDGRLVGLGLTLRPTRHRFTLDGLTMFGWCASDTLMFPVILGRAGVVDSTCPETGDAIHIELTPEGVGRLEPAAAVMTAVRPAGEIRDVRSMVCDHGHFYSSAGAARGWAGDHPDGFVRPIEEAVRLDRTIIGRVGWAAA